MSLPTLGNAELRHRTATGTLADSMSYRWYPPCYVGCGVPVTLRIEVSSDGGIPVLRLSGRVQAGHLEELAAQLANRPGAVLDLAEVTLVDLETVRFLKASEAEGTRLRHCPAYVREWIRREQPAPQSAVNRDDIEPTGAVSEWERECEPRGDERSPG
jgi:hypothetical protein